MADESGAHWTVVGPVPLTAAICFSPVSSEVDVGVGCGVGTGAGVAGGCVTNVIVCGCARLCCEAVFAPDPMVTWYCVFGARLPLVGSTCRVLPSHEYATWVA